MKLYDIDTLTTDSNQSGLYNLFQPTFQMGLNYPNEQHIVSPEEEMRIDLVCQAVYGSTDYCDFILNINNIDNPLNIMTGDVLLCHSPGAFEDFKVSKSQIVNAQNQLLNVNKSTKVDNNRQSFVEQNYSLQPTFKEIPSAPVQVINNQIVIGG
jgi:hypothetical protein